MFTCPFCSDPRSDVVNSRKASEQHGKAIMRRRRCQGCSNRFTTLEHAIDNNGLLIGAKFPTESLTRQASRIYNYFVKEKL